MSATSSRTILSPPLKKRSSTAFRNKPCNLRLNRMTPIDPREKSDTQSVSGEVSRSRRSTSSAFAWFRRSSRGYWYQEDTSSSVLHSETLCCSSTDVYSSFMSSSAPLQSNFKGRLGFMMRLSIKNWTKSSTSWRRSGGSSLILSSSSGVIPTPCYTSGFNLYYSLEPNY